MWALGFSNKIHFSESKPLPAQRGPSGAAGAGQGVTQSPWADPHGPNPALLATQVCWGMPCCSNTPWWEHWASSLFADLSASAPPFPGWFPTPVLLQKVLEEHWPESASLSYKPQTLLLSHVVQECKQILVVKWFSLHETQLDRLAFNSISPELHVWTRHSAEINFL